MKTGPRIAETQTYAICHATGKITADNRICEIHCWTMNGISTFY